MLHLFSKETPAAATKASLSSITKKLSKPFVFSSALLLSAFSGNIAQASAEVEIEKATVTPVSITRGCNETANNLLDALDALRRELTPPTVCFKPSKKAELVFNAHTKKGRYVHKGHYAHKRYVPDTEVKSAYRLDTLDDYVSIRNAIIHAYFNIIIQDLCTHLIRLTNDAYSARPFEWLENLCNGVANRLATAEIASREEKLREAINNKVEEGLKTFLATQSTMSVSELLAPSSHDDMVSPTMLYVEFLLLGDDASNRARRIANDSEFDFKAFEGIFGDILNTKAKAEIETVSDTETNNARYIASIRFGLNNFTQTYFLDRRACTASLEKSTRDFEEAKTALLEGNFFGKPGRIDLTYVDEQAVRDERGAVSAELAGEDIGAAEDTSTAPAN